MQSTMMSFVRRSSCAPKTFNSTIRLVTIGLAGFAIMMSPAAALVTGAGNTLQHQLKQNSSITEVRARAAAAWAGAPPAPGYRWYYTDPSRTQGFWDVCP
jgi:hypothetical protein